MRHWQKAVTELRKEKYGLKSDQDIGDVPIDGPVSSNSAMKDLLG